MKKKILIPIIIGIAVLLICGVAWFLISPGSNYEILVAATEKVAVTKDGLQVEAGETVTIPQAEVYDKNGDFCEDFTVSRNITDEKGNKKAGTLQMEHGQIYTVTYVADNGNEQLEKTMKLYCYDTILPEVSLLKLQKSYNVKETVVIQVKDASKDIDYNKSDIKLVNQTTGEETTLSFTEGYQFVAETEAEQYSVVCSLTDNSGNENVQKFEFVIAGEFEDKNIDKNNIWDFDEIGYMNNVKLAGTSEEMQYEIVTEELPADDNNVGVSGGALKVSLKAGETYDFSLVDGNTFKILDSATIGFKIWADEVVDIFEVYNVEDNTMHDLSWKVYKRNTWQTVEFDPQTIFLEDYLFASVRIVLSCERDVTLYIDSVYYTDYVEPWRDEDLKEKDLAVFDDPRYLERITETSNVDSATFGGTWEQVSEITGTTDFTGGALKLTSSTAASIGYDKNSRDGFKFQLFDRLNADNMEGLIVRVYCEDPHVALAVNFVDKKMGESRFIWPSLEGSEGNWINAVIYKDELISNIDGFEDITHLNIRFIRSDAATVEGKENYVTYVDKISLYELDYNKVKYTFADDYDMRVVTEVNSGTGFRVTDEGANDGYVLNAKTAFSEELSGVELSFNNLDVSKYSSIYMRLRSTDSIELWLNGEYANFAKYDKYTEIDLLPYLLQMKEKKLKSLTIGRKTVQDIDIYIDEITFITKEDAPKYKDFTIKADAFKKNAGSGKYSHFEGGSLTNVEKGSVKNGYYNGKNNVLSFKTTLAKEATKDALYSGGGVYVDFSNKLPRGKIQSSVDFTIHALVYSKATAALRVGILWGDLESDHSWKNVWVDISTETTGWQTISITSDKLRALKDCADKEITGIYLAVHNVNCTFAIQEVNVDFGSNNSYPNYRGDDSYLKQRDENSVYFSNFNSAEILENVDEIGINPWMSNVVEEKGTVSHKSIKSEDGIFTGIQLQIDEQNAYSAFNYHLPATFNLNKAKALVFRIAAKDWSNGYVPAFIYLTSGDKKVNVIEYSKIYVSSEAKGTTLSKVECLDGVNYRTVCIAIDVNSLMKKAGIKTIDGFIFGHSHSGLPQIVDEFYYVKAGAKEEEESKEPEYGKLVKTYFTTKNTVSNGCTLTDTENGLQLTDSAWTTGLYTFTKPLNGKEINTITVRFKVTGGESAIMYLYSGQEYFYIELNNVPAEQVVSRTIDADGFTILTLNFQTFSMDSGDTWLPKTRSTKALTDIALCCNNATGAPIFAYIDFNVKTETEEGGDEDTTEGIQTTEFSTSNTEANGYVMSDTEQGLQITGAAWVYAMHTLEKPVSGADIQNISVRFDVTGGESAIMKFFSGEEFFYVELNNPTGQGLISKTVDAEGFTILTLNFQTFAMDAGDTWTIDERATKNLTAIGICCNNTTGAPTFDYVAYNVETDDSEGDEGETVISHEVRFSTSNVSSNGYTMTNTANGLQITGAAWVYAMSELEAPISGGDINTVTIRFKVTGGESAIMKFFSGDEFFYVELNNPSGEGIVAKTVDAEGFTILTLDFQTFAMDAGDTWLPNERLSSDLTAIGLCCNNVTGAPTFDYVAFNVE